MNITEVRVILPFVGSGNGHQERLLAFANITLDGDFVIHDLKVILGNRGVMVCMPSRPRSVHCQQRGCGAKNSIRALYCNFCGARLVIEETGERPFVDIAHPITQEARDLATQAVLKEYYAEVERQRPNGNNSLAS